MTLRLIIPPAQEPVSLAEAKMHCRVSGDAEDALLTTFIRTARRQAEQIIGAAIIEQTWERVLDAFPPVEIQLGMPPVTEVLQVSYLDPAGFTQIVPAASYVLDEVRTPGWVLPAAGASWPGTSESANAVRVLFRCGMGETADEIDLQAPEVREWMLLQVGAMYENRAAIAQGRPATELPGGFGDRLLDRLKVY